MVRSLRDPDLAADAEKLKSLLPPGVSVVWSGSGAAEAQLHPAEQHFLTARRMQPVREREFRLGRTLAREALARLGINDHALLPSETREPQWPRGIVGSISHCDGICAVAVAESTAYSALGIDLERIDRIDESIADTVCTPEERSRLAAMTPSARRQRLGIIFSAKESVFKALFPLKRQFLEFHDVSLAIADGKFAAQPASPGVENAELLSGRFFAGSHLIATAAWLPAA